MEGCRRRETCSSSCHDTRRLDSIQNETLNVIDFPKKCWLLNAKEIDITNLQVCVLLENMGKGILSAVEGTTAFSKRAVVALDTIDPASLSVT